MIKNELNSDNIDFSETLKISEHEDIPKVPKRQLQKNDYKLKSCRVISYNEKLHTLDIMFDNYGIRIKNVGNFIGGDTVNIKYKGKIGESNFEIKL